MGGITSRAPAREVGARSGRCLEGGTAVFRSEFPKSRRLSVSSASVFSSLENGRTGGYKEGADAAGLPLSVLLRALPGPAAVRAREKDRRRLSEYL